MDDEKRDPVTGRTAGNQVGFDAWRRGDSNPFPFFSDEWWGWADHDDRAERAENGFVGMNPEWWRKVMSYSEAIQALKDMCPGAKLSTAPGQLLVQRVRMEVEVGFQISEIQEAKDLWEFVARRLLAGIISKMKKRDTKCEGGHDGQAQECESAHG